jgi:hypothetical protein
VIGTGQDLSRRTHAGVSHSWSLHKLQRARLRLIGELNEMSHFVSTSNAPHTKLNPPRSSHGQVYEYHCLPMISRIIRY